MTILTEIVCSTVADACAAEAGGADRIELCTGLAVGGLTPSLGLLEAVKEATHLPVMAMVRPRPSGFCYSQADLRVMASDAKILLRYGADGLVFGALREDGQVEDEMCRRIVEIAGGRQTVFHRAFDVTPDPFAALDTLLACAVTRILSSGQQPTAMEGAVLLRQLRDRSAGGIEILPGGGIRAHNVRELLAQTGCDQVHLAPMTPRHDPTSGSPSGIHYGGDSEITVAAVSEFVRALSA